MPATVQQAQALGRSLGLDRLDTQLLLAHVLDQPRAWVMAHDEAPLSTEQATRFEQLAQQRADDVPLAYLVGRREFMGLDLQVGPDVLVPRADTETLVTWALDLLDAAGPASPSGRPAVLDLGTGSGAVALAIAKERPHARVFASDRSPAALAIARQNARRLGRNVHWLQGSWWQALRRAGPGPEQPACFDLIVSNPPYIATQDPHLPALRHEPREALVAGADGLDDIRILVAGAPAHLAPGAWLLLEHGHKQGPAVRTLLSSPGWQDTQTRSDLAGLPRCTGARWRP